MGKLARIALNIALAIAAIFLFEHFFPRDAAAARDWLEGEGYQVIEVRETKRRCGRNRQVFVFEALRASGEQISAELCFALIRPFSSVTEVAK